jgi:amino acid transporter
MINRTAVGLELVIVVVLAIALAVAVAVTGNGSLAASSRGVTENTPTLAVGGLMLAMVMGLTTLVGFAAANLAEEAKDLPQSARDRRIGRSGLLLGLVFLIALTVAIDDISGSVPASHVIDHARSARSGNGTDVAGRDHVRVLRRRDGDPGHRLADRLCDGATLAFPLTG